MADQSARDFPECVALAAAEFDALGGEALRRLAGQRLERARADRNDVGQEGGRRVAQDVNLGGALGRRRLSLARRRGARRNRRRLARAPPPPRVEGASGASRRARRGEIRLHRLRRRSRGACVSGSRRAQRAARSRLGRLLGGAEPNSSSSALERNLRARRGGGNIAPARTRDSVRAAPRRFREPRLGRGICPPAGRRIRSERRGRHGLDLLAQHAKAAIAQKFAMTAEQRRGGKRDHPAPAELRERPLDREPEKVCRSPSARASASPPSNPARRNKSLDGFAASGARWPQPRRRARDRPRRSGPPRRGSTGSANSATASRPDPASPRSSGCGASPRDLRGPGARGGSRARGAQSRNRRQKPARASRRADADAAQIDAGRPPVDDKAHLLEPRLANGKRRRQVAQAPRRRSLAPRQPSFERLAVLGVEQSEHGRARAHDRPGREQDRQPRIVVEPLAWRVMRVEGRGGLFARQGREIGGGRWRRVGQSRRS